LDEARRKRADLAREARRDLYMQLIGVCDDLSAVIGAPRLNRRECEEWWRRFESAASATELLATREVGSATLSAKTIIRDLREPLLSTAEEAST
jgi:hypothetical protein